MNKNGFVTASELIFGLLILGISCICPCPEGLDRQGVKYIGILLCMLFYLLVNLCSEYIVVMFTLAACVVLKVDTFSGIFSAFSNTTVWLLIGVLPLSVVISKSGLMKRIALHVLKLFPNTYQGQLLALTTAGIVISPMIPSITAKASILAPFAIEAAEEMKFTKKSKGMMGLFMAVYLMGAVSGHVFYSGSMNVFIMLGLLPADMQNEFTWGNWLMSTFIWGLCIYIIGFIVMRIIYKPENVQYMPSDYIANRIREMGPMTAEEKKVAIVLGITLLGWITKSLHGISEAAIAIIAYFLLTLMGVTKKRDFRGGVAWDMIIFIGGLMSMATLMSNLGIDTWIAEKMAPIISPMLINEYVFIISLSVLVAISRYFIVSAVSAVSLFYIVFAGPAQSIGISPWVTAFVITTIGQLWSTEYNSTTYLTSVAVVGEETLDFKEAVKMSHAYVLISIIGFVLSIPLWKYLGYII
ncbi:MAG: anion permease [Lachnospiraceae bacterium]|nr:anion permease [Lachnospiraceae bacterium]